MHNELEKGRVVTVGWDYNPLIIGDPKNEQSVDHFITIVDRGTTQDELGNIIEVFYFWDNGTNDPAKGISDKNYIKPNDQFKANSVTFPMYNGSSTNRVNWVKLNPTGTPKKDTPKTKGKND